MSARIVLKNGTAYTVDAYASDVETSWRAAVTEGTTPIVTYPRLGAGVPLPTVTIDLREVSSVEQERR